jgi:hypothetical protein
LTDFSIIKSLNYGSVSGVGQFVGIVKYRTAQYCNQVVQQEPAVALRNISKKLFGRTMAMAVIERAGRLFSTNRWRAGLLSFILLIPLIFYWEELASVLPSPPRSRADDATLFNDHRFNLPLFDAVKSADVERVRSLLDDGIRDKGQVTYYNVNAEDPKGLTPLIEATLLGNVAIVELLLVHGARAQPAVGYRHTPLRAACLTANTELIQVLLQKGAHPNAQSEGGRTPLMGACYLRPEADGALDRLDRSFEAVKAMLEDPRTDAGMKNDFGETALDLCRRRKYAKSMNVLRERTTGVGVSVKAAEA